jgi:Pescadillo N-terminus
MGLILSLKRKFDTVIFSVWQALLGFVNFKLYHSINVKYPPILDPRLEALSAGTCPSNKNLIKYLNAEDWLIKPYVIC